MKVLYNLAGLGWEVREVSFYFFCFIPTFSCNCLVLDQEMSLCSSALSPVFLWRLPTLCENPRHLNESFSVLCPAPGLLCAMWWRLQTELVVGARLTLWLGLLRILICHISSHVAINSSLKVWFISLYIFLCQFYSSCCCSARNEQSKVFSLLVSLWDLVCLGFPVIIRLVDDFLIYDFIVYPVLSHFWE